MTHAALPWLLQRPGARIVNIAAGAATKAVAGMGAYAAAKSGVARLTESLAEELKGRDITVNAVLPSIIDTPANRADMPHADTSDWVSPAALAEVILFLASPAGPRRQRRARSRHTRRLKSLKTGEVASSEGRGRDHGPPNAMVGATGFEPATP